MVRVLTFGNLKIWLFIQQLTTYHNNNSQRLLQTQEFICYFKFSEPTLFVYGELFRGTWNQQPMLFSSMEATEEFMSKYLSKRFHFNQTFEE